MRQVLAHLLNTVDGGEGDTFLQTLPKLVGVPCAVLICQTSCSVLTGSCLCKPTETALLHTRM